jgi:hypothetical protein
MRSAEVQSVSDLCTYIKESSFVAVSLLDHKDVPVIGKVLQKKKKTITIHYWKGSWNKRWVPCLTAEESHGRTSFQKNAFI